MADFVLNIAHSDLMTLMDHLPAVHQPWWQTFIQVGTPIITAVTSIVTTCVLIANRKLTKNFSILNHQLATQQSNTATENKEIAKRKYNLDVINKRWDLFGGYLADYRICSASIIGNFRQSYPDKISEIDEDTFFKFFLDDTSKRIKSLENIDAFFIMARSFSLPQTILCMDNLLSDITCFSKGYSEFNYKSYENHSINSTLLHLRKSIEELNDKMNASHDAFIEIFIKNELDGLKKID